MMPEPCGKDAASGVEEGAAAGWAGFFWVVETWRCKRVVTDGAVRLRCSEEKRERGRETREVRRREVIVVEVAQGLDDRLRVVLYTWSNVRMCREAAFFTTRSTNEDHW